LAKARAAYLGRSPAVRLSPGGHALRLVIDLLFYLAFPLQMLRFRQRLGYWPRPALPLRYHEKYLWRKLVDHDPRHVTVSDKIARKAVVRDLAPDIRIAETYWQGARAVDIPDEVLAGDCAIKANHGCAMNVFVREGAVDRLDLSVRTERWLRRAYGRRHHEWAYAWIPRRLFAEQLLVEDGRLVRSEFKFYVAGGVCAYATHKHDRFLETALDAVFDRAGQARRSMIETGRVGSILARPPSWDRLVAVAERLGAGFDTMRVDLFELGGEIWFSEFTVYPSAGYAWVDDAGLMDTLNRGWDLTGSWFLSSRQRGWRAAYARRLRAWLDGPAR